MSEEHSDDECWDSGLTQRSDPKARLLSYFALNRRLQYYDVMKVGVLREGRRAECKKTKRNAS